MNGDAEQHQIAARGEQLYERYAVPLEAAHAGKFIAISSDGRTVIGETMLDAAQRAEQELGNGVFLFKLGPRSAESWR